MSSDKWSQQKISKGWVGIRQNKKSNVWIDPIRTPGTTTTIRDMTKTGICTN